MNTLLSAFILQSIQVKYKCQSVRNYTKSFISLSKTRKMFKQHLKNISQQIDSDYGDNQPRKQIDYDILDKHLNNNYPIVLQYAQDLVDFISPYWELSLSQFTKNIKYLIMSQWKFENNQSGYLAFWVPLTTLLLMHFIIDKPFENKMRIYLTAVIQIFLTVATSLASFVFSTMIDTVFKQYPKHLCVSSFMGLLTLIYCLLAVISPQVLLIIESIIFIGVAVYFHLGVYNKSMKPTLLQMLGLLISLIIIYTCAAIAFIHIYQPSLNQDIKPLGSQSLHKHNWAYRQYSSIRERYI